MKMVETPAKVRKNQFTVSKIGDPFDGGDNTSNCPSKIGISGSNSDFQKFRSGQDVTGVVRN